MREIVARFEPIKEIMYPEENAPTNDPMQLMDPTHEMSSFVSGPDMRGVFSDVKRDKAGEIQAGINPYAIIIRFTGIKLFEITQNKIEVESKIPANVATY